MSALLLRADGYEPEYRGGLTSHLPMALTALHRLGASEARCAPHRGQFRGRLISTTMAYAASLPEFKQLTAALPRDQDLLDQLAALALALFAATGDFTALHALTGTHAFRVVSGHLEDAREATQFLTVALLAAYADMGAPPLPSDEVLAVLRATPAPDWSELVARAIEADDDHVIKVTYSAREEDALYHDPLYRVAIHRYQQRHR